VLLLFFVYLILFPAPTRVNQTPVGERLIKSKIIPEQARALANALKHAVVNPFKKTITKKKSFDTNLIEQQLTSSYQPIFSNQSSIIIENSDQQLNEISIDSVESISPGTLTPPPAKPPRQTDETDSSSSNDIIHSVPPAKPPRHFSLYENEHLMQQTENVVKKVLDLADTYGTVSQDDKDMNVLREPSLGKFRTSGSLKPIQRFTVQPTRIAMNSHVPIKTISFDNEINKPMIITSVSSSTDKIVPKEITQLARDLTENILQDIQRDLQIQNPNQQVLFAQLEQQQQTNTTSYNTTPSFPHSIVTTHVSPTHSASRPLMFVSLDTESSNPTKVVSPLHEIVTTKSTPIFTTSVRVISLPPTLVSSTTTVSNFDDEINNNNNKTSDRSKSLQTICKQSSLDSNDTPTNDNTVFSSQNTDNATSARSLLSDYDNLHGSYGSVHDDNQPTPIISPPLPSSSETISSTASSSTTTIYESLDNFSTSSPTSPSYVSAVSTFNTGGTTTPSQRFNSDISDEDFIEIFDIERLSQGRKSRIQSTDMFIYSWHVFYLPFPLPFPLRMAWQNQFTYLKSF
jgi:hypothetical protein